MQLARAGSCDLVIVAANRLGVLNHALLTVREAERAGLRVRAVVLNAVRPMPADVAEATNADALRSLLGDVPLVVLPFLDAERHTRSRVAGGRRRAARRHAPSRRAADVIPGPCTRG